jgi:FixJ family two-component response regulator
MTTKPPVQSGNVFIVDDDLSYLQATSRLLRAAGYSVQAFSSAQELLERLAPDLSGCVIADMQMPGINGMELLAALKNNANPLPVIFLTGEGDIPTSVTAMRSGAENFLTKLAPKETLLAAVNLALERDARERSERVRLRELRERLDALSERETQVLSHVVRGRMNKEIAADLDINLRTVKLHRTNITRKLKVRSVAELTRFADEAGLFQTLKNDRVDRPA